MANVKCGIIKENKKRVNYFSVLQLVNDSLHIKLCEIGNGKGWVSHFDSRSISNWVERTNLSADEYMQQSLAALTGNNKINNYIIELDEHDSTGEVAELSWKKKLSEDEEILFKIGCVTLQRTKCHDDMFRIIIDSVNSLQTELEDVKKRSDSLEDERSQLLRKVDECCSSKQQMEAELYSKFAQVLNEKKRKIEQLQNAKEPTVKKVIEEVKITKRKAPVKAKKLPEVDDRFVLDPMESESQDLEPIRPSSASGSKPKRVMSSPDVDVQAENLDETVDYDADTLPTETQDLLADL
ncbi:DNA repair protein xrcc4 [Chamberlinius hualienensis]